MMTDLAFIAQQARQNADDYEAFRYYVEDELLSDAELDELVEKIAAPIIAAIDCTQCGNCCRHLDVYLTPQDGERLAARIDIPLAEIVDYSRAQEEGEWGVFRRKPCQFLQGNLCTVYEHRPVSCREYPAFTPDFRWLLGDILGGVGLCPIVYNTLEELKKHLRW